LLSCAESATIPASDRSRTCAAHRRGDREDAFPGSTRAGLNAMADYWLTRLVFQRGLGLVYLTAFVCALNQFRPLLGEHGLLPVPIFARQTTFSESPSLFLFVPKDWA